MAAYRSSSEVKASCLRIVRQDLVVRDVGRRDAVGGAARAQTCSLPWTMFSSRRSFLNHCLIFVRAAPLLASLSQSRLGPGRVFRREDVDDVAVLQHVVEGHDAAVDLRADHAVADRGVDAVGEVDRRRAGGEVDDVALRREHEHLVGEHVHLQVVEEVLRVRLLLRLEQAADPGELLLVAGAWRPRRCRSCISSAPRRRTPPCGASPTCGSAPRTGCPPSR